MIRVGLVKRRLRNASRFGIRHDAKERLWQRGDFMNLSEEVSGLISMSFSSTIDSLIKLRGHKAGNYFCHGNY